MIHVPPSDKLEIVEEATFYEVESVWFLLKNSIQQHSHTPTSITELKETVLQAWEEISVEDVSACILSMPDRLKAVSKAFGGPINY